MIQYDSGAYFGFGVIFRLRGSVLPRVLPFALTSVLLTVVLNVFDLLKDGRELLAHPYAHQVFAISVGFVLVFRGNLSYSRFWEGRTNLQTMTSKWDDAAQQVMSFNSHNKTEELKATALEFEAKVIHLFTLMHALAMQRLRSDHDLGNLDPILGRDAGAKPKPSAPGPKSGFASTSAGLRYGLTRRPTSVTMSALAAHEKGLPPNPPSSSNSGVPINIPRRRRKSFDEGSVSTPQSARSISSLFAKAEETAHPLLVVGPLSKKEIQALECVEQRVYFVMTQLVNLLVDRHVAGGLAVPPPVFSRTFQVLSDGMLAFMNCRKISDTPFPFPYSQLVSLLLLVFMLTAPVIIVAYVDSLIFGIVLAFFSTASFYSLNEVANEIEDPFGYDENDLDIPGLHFEFVNRILSLRDPIHNTFETIPFTMAELNIWESNQNGGSEPSAPASDAGKLALETSADTPPSISARKSPNIPSLPTIAERQNKPPGHTIDKSAAFDSSEARSAADIMETQSDLLSPPVSAGHRPSPKVIPLPVGQEVSSDPSVQHLTS